MGKGMQSATTRQPPTCRNQRRPQPRTLPVALVACGAAIRFL